VLMCNFRRTLRHRRRGSRANRLVAAIARNVPSGGTSGPLTRADGGTTISGSSVSALAAVSAETMLAL